MKALNELTATFRNNPYGVLLSTAWAYAEGMRLRYVLIYLMFTVVNVLASALPILFGYFVNYLQAGEGDLMTATLLYGGIYLGIVLGTWVFQWPARLLEREMAFEISKRLLLETYEKVIALPLDWHRRHHSGDTINRARRAYEALKNFFDAGFIYFQTIARMTIALGALFYFSPLFGAIAGAIGILLIAAVLAFDRPIIAATSSTNDRENELQARLSDSLGNIITVTTLRLGERTQGVVSKSIAAVWPPFRRTTVLNERKWFTAGVINGLMYVSIVVGYVYQNYTPGEAFLVGGLVTLVGYVQQFSNMFNNLTAQYNQIIKYRTDLAAIEPIRRAYAERAVPRSSVPGKADWWESVAVTGLNFRYRTKTGREAGLYDLSVNLRRGQRTALIGPSGSGKTTLLYALRGLYPAERIEVRFDDEAAPPQHLYGQTTLIPQSPEIFEESLLNNLTMGLEHLPLELVHVSYLSVLDPVIDAAEEGLNTHLAEGGANLSGGQRQRISIARGLLAASTSSVLLLDEPTSSLDPETEQLVYERIFAAYPEKAIVSSLHRLHLLNQFDYIYYMEEGRVVEEGTFGELIEAGGRVRALYDSQTDVALAQ